MKYEKKVEIDVGRCFRVLRRNWWFMAVMAVVFGIAGVALTLEKEEDIYSASSSVYVMSPESYEQTQMGITAMNAYADIAAAGRVCERAALLMGVENVTGEDIKAATTLSVGEEREASAYAQKNSSIMVIECKANHAIEARKMAQAVAEAFVIEMENMMGTEVVRVLDKAYAYEVVFDAAQNQWRIRIMACLAGVIFAAGIIVLAEIFDSKARTVRECTMRDELAIIGVIPRTKK